MKATLLLLLAACAGAPVAAERTPTTVDGATAKKLVADGARLVDVRGPDFYAKEHIAGAINIPWADVPQRAQEIGPQDTPVVLYCRTGAGSGKAAAMLVRMGYTRVYDLGSYLNWGEGAPAPTPLPPSATAAQPGCEPKK